MNYKLAKQLKEAGFPQGVKGRAKDDYSVGNWVYDEPVDKIKPKKETPRSYIPTLSELIEACGDEFEALERIRGYWTASGKISANERIRTHLCKTPKEAVAKLWLKLNNKL